MYRNILAATDGSDLATAGVKQAASIARAFNANLTIVTAAVYFPMYGDEGGLALPPASFDEIHRASLEHCADVLSKAAEIAGPGAQTETVECFNAYEGILETAENIGADLIVMGSHSRSLITRLVLGSQAAKVVNLSTISVLIVR